MNFRASRIAVMALACGVAVPLLPSGAAAQGYDSGFFAGGAVTWANFDGDRFGVVFGEDAWGYKVFAGMDVLPYLGVEVARADFGDAEGREGTAEICVETDTWAIAVIGQIPVNEKFSVFAKAGYQFWEYEARATGGFQWWEKADGGDPFVGLGMRYYFGRHLFLLGEYEAYRVHSFDYDNLNLGLGWKF